MRLFSQASMLVVIKKQSESEKSNSTFIYRSAKMQHGIGYSSTQPRFIGAHPQTQGKFCPAEPVTPSESLPK